MEPARSHRNPAVVDAARLHRAEERRGRGQTLLEGPHLVGEAVAAGVRMVKVFALADDLDGVRWAEQSGGELITVGEGALERLSGTKSPQGPVAVIDIPERPLDPSRSVLVAWQISDPGNLGTMIRTAAAFGLDVAVSEGSVDVWSPKVLRAAAGGHFHTNLAEISDPAQIDAVRVATVVKGGEPLGKLPAGRLALLIGSEAHGLPGHIVDAADLRVTIPMPGPTESLNSAVAAAILIFVATR